MFVIMCLWYHGRQAARWRGGAPHPGIHKSLPDTFSGPGYGL